MDEAFHCGLVSTEDTERAVSQNAGKKKKGNAKANEATVTKKLARESHDSRPRADMRPDSTDMKRVRGAWSERRETSG